MSSSSSFFRVSLGTKHPYSPESAHLPGYEPAMLNFGVVLAVFFGATALVGAGTWTRTAARFPSVSKRERSIVTWLSLTALIHLVVEGYVVLDGRFYSSKSRLNFLAEVWKEYAKADSRYATRDAFTICMESVTAFFVGPLCLFAAHQYCMRGPWRHLAALVASACQLYGDALYFATCFYENGVHTRPEPLYFWFYFVGLNSLWVFVPLGVSWHAVRETVRAQRRADESGWRVAGGGGKQK